MSEGSSIHQAGEKGIAIVYQELTLVPGMTVGENIFLGKEPVERFDYLGSGLFGYQKILDKYKLDVHPQAMSKT